MKEIRHLKTMKNKTNLNIKWLLLQSDQNADTTLLHSHDGMRLKVNSISNHSSTLLILPPPLSEIYPY